MGDGLAGLRIVSFESRRSEEMATLIAKQGGEPVRAPSMREVPLTDQHAAIRWGERFLAGESDVVVLLTGVGTRMLIDALATRYPREAVIAALGRVPLVCRGPKPVAALKQVGLQATVAVPEPNTWRDLLAALDRELPVRGKRVAVQEYGRPNDELLAGLRERGADVTSVPVYGYELPEDTGPLESAVRRLALGEADVVLFTTAQQVEHMMLIAERLRVGAELRAALARRVLIASIGPVTSEMLAEHGLSADLTPEHPKMGHLVQAVARQGRELLAQKRQP